MILHFLGYNFSREDYHSDEIDFETFFGGKLNLHGKQKINVLLFIQKNELLLRAEKM